MTTYSLRGSMVATFLVCFLFGVLLVVVDQGAAAKISKTRCRPGQSATQTACLTLSNKCLSAYGIGLKWTPSGICVCDRFCGYMNATLCGQDSQCYWGPGGCANSLTGRVGKPLNRRVVCPATPRVFAKDISSGSTFVCATETSGKRVKCWGELNYGPAGNVSQSVHVALVVPGVNPNAGLITKQCPSGPSSHMCFIQNGNVKCWGRLNTHGRLGDGTDTPRYTAVSVVNLQSGGVTDISCGLQHTCAVRNKTVYCWGANTKGELGQPILKDYFSPQKLPFAELEGKVDAVATGAEHTCVISHSKTRVYCWGLNSHGQLGRGYTNLTNAFIPQPQQVVLATLGPVTFNRIFAAQYTTCFAPAVGNIQCWGSNQNGELGDESFVNPRFLLPATVVNIPLASNIGSFAPGSHLEHGCAVISSTGEARCWGVNNRGQLGSGSISNPVNVAQKVLARNNAKHWKIDTSFGVTCSIDMAKAVWCWGTSTYGQLGSGNSSITQSFTAVRVIDGNF